MFLPVSLSFLRISTLFLPLSGVGCSCGTVLVAEHPMSQLMAFISLLMCFLVLVRYPNGFIRLLEHFLLGKYYLIQQERQIRNCKVYTFEKYIWWAINCKVAESTPESRFDWTQTLTWTEWQEIGFWSISVLLLINEFLSLEQPINKHYPSSSTSIEQPHK